jgi:hypothetical protein
MTFIQIEPKSGVRTYVNLDAVERVTFNENEVTIWFKTGGSLGVRDQVSIARISRALLEVD